MSLLIAKVVITERMSFTHAMQQIAANGKRFSYFNAVYQFINSLSYNWPRTTDRWNHLLNCSAEYNALVGLVSANDGVQVIQFPRWPGILFHDQKAWKSSEIWNNCERPLQWKPTHVRAFSSWSKLSFQQQIGWVTGKDPCNFGCCWKGIRLAKLSCQNWQASAKNMGDKFTKITIFKICGALWNN